MGMDISANIALGVIVLDQDGSINTGFNSEEYEDDLVEYLEDKLDSTLSVNIAGSCDYPDWLVTINKYTFGVDWTAKAIDVNELIGIDMDAELKVLTDKLDKLGVEYKSEGLLLYPYFSH